jgi:hypothetical protein
MANIHELADPAFNSKDVEEVFLLPVGLRSFCIDSVTKNESLELVETKLKSHFSLRSLGWFAQRKIRKDILKLHGNLSKNGLGLAVQACRSLALAEMLSEVAANCSDPEKTILFQRFIANLKKKMGSSLIEMQVSVPTHQILRALLRS